MENIGVFRSADCGQMRQLQAKYYSASLEMPSKRQLKQPSSCAGADRSNEKRWNWNANRIANETHLASRRYEAVDPDNRLVAAELEASWNVALRKAHEFEAKL
jgi:hypothetical protein